MPIDLLTLIPFLFGMMFTPGPNNIMLSASGINHGFRLSLPHVMGVLVGATLLFFIIALSYGIVVSYFPKIQTIILIISLAILSYLTWRIASTPPPGDSTRIRKPIHFLEAFSFQAVNPKSWIVSMTTIGVFLNADTDEARIVQLFIIVTACALMILCSALSWLMLGMTIRNFLKTDLHYRLFNYFAAGLLVFCGVYIAYNEWFSA